MPSSAGLRAGDLPAGWKRAGTSVPPTAAQLTALYSCLGAPVPALAGQVSSATYTSGDTIAYSVTRAFPSASAAAADLALKRGPAFVSCGSAYVTQVFNRLPAGSTFGPVTVTVPAFAGLGDTAVLHRLTMPFSAAGRSRTAEADLFTVVRGPIEVEVVFAGARPGLPSEQDEVGVVRAAVSSH